MLIVNKVAISVLPAPTFILVVQLTFTSLVVWVGDTLGWLKADAMEWGLIKKFAIVILGFLGILFTNLKVSALPARMHAWAMHRHAFPCTMGGAPCI